MNLVIDASVLIKFYVPEILSAEAGHLLARMQRGEVALRAPDLLYAETGNILWKKQRLGELTPSDVEEIAEAIISLPLNIETSKSLLPLALDVGMMYGITVYDAIYISTAMVHEIRMVTADRKLVDTLAKTDLKEYVSWLGNP